MANLFEEFTFPSDYGAVRTALAKLLGHLRAAGLGAEDTGTIELVLAEALNNVVEHAYQEATDGQILVAWGLCDATLCVRIEDTGRPMPGLVLPTGICPTSDTDLEDLPEGGFGWHLIHTLTEELSYRRESTRNQTRFIIPLSDGT